MRTGTRAEAIDLDAGTVHVRVRGETLGYDHLLVATGGRPPGRPFPGLDADGVHGVHRLADGADTGAPSGRARSGPSSSAAGTSASRWPTCCMRAGCDVTVVLADPLPMVAAGRRHG